MVRSALASKRIGQGPVMGAEYMPAASVVLGTFVSALPIVAESGWFPDFGFLMLIAWRLLRSDVWPSWWAAPLGLANDLITGSPVGLSVTVWTVAMLALDLLDRRTQWRDYWIEWGIAALFIALAELAQWRVAALLGASVPLGVTAGPAILVGILCFPIPAFLAARIDRWRLGR